MAHTHSVRSPETQGETEPPSAMPTVRRYALAPVSVLGAWAATSLLWIQAPHRPLSLVFFFAAVAISAGFGGLGPGILATALSALACDFFFLQPLHTLFVSRSDLPLMLLFIVVAALINVLSERLQAETRAAEQRFHDRVQGLDAIVWAADPQTLQFTFVSRRAEKLLGYPSARWVAEPDFRETFLHRDDRDRVLAACRRFVKEGGDHAMEYRVNALDGREVWLRETVHIVRDAHDVPMRVTGLCVDITERKQAEEENAELRDALTTLHGITTAMTASLDLATVLATLKRELKQHIRVPASLLFLYSEETAEWRLADAWGLPFRELPPPAHLAQGSFEELRVPHLGSGPPPSSAHPLAAAASIPELAAGGLDAYLWMPLMANGDLQGAVCLFDTSLARFNENRLAFFETLGRQTGVIIQNARLYGQVNDGRASLQRLSHRLVGVQEEERRHIARELHDEIGQMLTGLKLRLETCARKSPSAVSGSLDEPIALVGEMMRQVRDLSLELRPAVLDDLGLLPALVWHFERYTHLTGVTVRFDHCGIDSRFSYDVETTVYRIVQEAITNVARHANTHEVSVRVKRLREYLLVEIADGGKGFAAEAAPGLSATGGLLGIRERVTLLGGQFGVESAPDGGTRLYARLPVDKLPGDGE